VIEIQRVTLEEFERLIQEPAHIDTLFEYIGGEIVDAPSNPYSSKIAARISGYLFMYLLNNDIGHLSGEAGGYQVSGERYAPDVAFLSYDTQPGEIATEGYNPNPLDLAVEVICPTDSEKHLRIKVANYQAAGTPVWVVNPADETVEIYEAGQPVRVLDTSGTLRAEAILPGFELPVRQIFPEPPRHDDPA
jgi:Uma2 family endonuclease